MAEMSSCSDSTFELYVDRVLEAAKAQVLHTALSFHILHRVFMLQKPLAGHLAPYPSRVHGLLMANGHFLGVDSKVGT
jgi:hypothetical protein